VIDLDDLENDDNMFAEESKQPTGDSSSMIRRVRKYDLSITYDFYTQTPRLWLTGYSEDGAPLTQKEIFEDIAADYAKKTVTMESHPHTGVKQASIHPCNHAKVMKTIIDTIMENGGEPKVEQCLFVFLKFISSVVPTIHYDFTVDLELE
jgi:ubiquitin-like-conjugating enzyme ATG3